MSKMNETHKEKMERKKRERANPPKMNPVGLNATSLMNGIYNGSPHMIHENNYVPMDCVLCGTEMESIHDTHNPSPLTDECFAKESHETGNPNRCCSKCNQKKVIPARMGLNSDSVEVETKSVSMNELREMMEKGLVAPFPNSSKKIH